MKELKTREERIAWLESDVGQLWSSRFHKTPTDHVYHVRGSDDPCRWYTAFAEVKGGTKHARNPNTHPWSRSRWRPRIIPNPQLDPTRGGTP